MLMMPVVMLIVTKYTFSLMANVDDNNEDDDGYDDDGDANG